MNDRLITMLAVVLIIVTPATAKAHVEDDPLLVMLMLQQLEWRDIGGDNAIAWDGQGWFGRDLTKIWIKSEGERRSGDTEEAELQFLYSKAVTTYWDFQLGLRYDFKPSPSRSWAAIGFQGLAPYFFEIDTVLFIGESGRTAVRFKAEYELLLTQRLILTPEIELNLYGRNDPETGVGSGLSDIEAGLRLRYEIRREIAPYIGLNWSQRYGNTADFAQAGGQSTSESQFTVGIRAWF